MPFPWGQFLLEFVAPMLGALFVLAIVLERYARGSRRR